MNIEEEVCPAYEDGEVCGCDQCMDRMADLADFWRDELIMEGK